MPRVIVFADLGKPRVAAVVDAVRPWLEARAELVWRDFSAGDDAPADEADLAVVFGGDGAMLRSARALGERQIPIVGVNLGKFGFLAEVRNDEIEPALERILAGDYEVKPRMMLECEALRGERVLARGRAVNDAVVSRGALSRLASIELKIDSVRVTTYNADGLIVSTPVGSTAHSLSAGGPIVNPALDAFIITPICPHTLTNRPLVEPAGGEIEMAVRSKASSVGLTIDGQVYVELECGDCVRVRRAKQRLLLISIGVRQFHETLHEKLHWGGHPRYASDSNSG